MSKLGLGIGLGVIGVAIIGGVTLFKKSDCVNKVDEKIKDRIKDYYNLLSDEEKENLWRTYQESKK